MTEEKREWQTDPIKKFGDVAPLEVKLRRRLPPLARHTQYEETAEIQMRREADGKFRIKRSS